MKKINKLVQISMLIALMIVGSLFKITGSISFDSLAGFVGAAIFGPTVGFCLGTLGHLATAMLVGFPFGTHIHMIIALLMGICLFCYGKAKEKNVHYLISDIIAYFINVPVSLIILSPLMTTAVWGLFLPLSLATVINIFCAEVILRNNKLIKKIGVSKL